MPQLDALTMLSILRDAGCESPLIFVSGTYREPATPNLRLLRSNAKAHDSIPHTSLSLLVPAVEQALAEATARARRRGRRKLPRPEPVFVPKRENRKHPRVQLGMDVELILPTHVSFRAELTDMSEGGCFFKTFKEPELVIGSTVSFAFIMAPGAQCCASGMVVRLATGWGFGVEFFEINSGLREFVRTALCMTPEDRAEVLSRVERPVVCMSAQIRQPPQLLDSSELRAAIWVDGERIGRARNAIVVDYKLGKRVRIVGADAACCQIVDGWLLGKRSVFWICVLRADGLSWLRADGASPSRRKSADFWILALRVEVSPSLAT